MAPAIGMIEVEGVAGIIVGADAAAKAANVKLMGWESIGGFTTLFFRGRIGDVDTASKLLGKGANVNDQENKAGVTPLSVAAEEGHVEMARVLVEHGADLEAGEHNGYTPLSRALWRDQKEVVSLLQQSGAACQPIETLGKAVHSRCVAGTP